MEVKDVVVAIYIHIYIYIYIYLSTPKSKQRIKHGFTVEMMPNIEGIAHIIGTVASHPSQIHNSMVLHCLLYDNIMHISVILICLR